MLEVVRFRGVLISEHSHRMNKLLKSHQQKGQSMYSRRDRLMYGLGGLGGPGEDERDWSYLEERIWRLTRISFGLTPPDILPNSPLQEGGGDWRAGLAWHPSNASHQASESSHSHPPSESSISRLAKFMDGCALGSRNSLPMKTVSRTTFSKIFFKLSPHQGNIRLDEYP